MTVPEVRALTFDVFGTVVDWRGTIIELGNGFNQRKRLQIDWAAFADAWRAEYGPSMDRVRQGELGWTRLDELHEMNLYKVLHDFGIAGLSDDEISTLHGVWHRLNPWPDAVSGIRRLKERYIVATLSNGDVAMLVNITRHAGLPWDCILSAELVRHYKPDPQVYRSAAHLLDLPPGQVMMVAAHASDLRAAAGVGFRTAYVSRPQEYGPAPRLAAVDSGQFDVSAEDFNDLADQLLA